MVKFLAEHDKRSNIVWQRLSGLNAFVVMNLVSVPLLVSCAQILDLWIVFCCLALVHSLSI